MGKAIKLSILVLAIILISFVYSANYEFFYNPYTAKQDRSLSLNQTGNNFTADYFFGDGSSLTGILQGDLILYFLNKQSTDITGNKTLTSIFNSTEVNLSATSMADGSTLLGTWITDLGVPNIKLLGVGNWQVHVVGFKSGTKTVQFYWELYKTNSTGGAESLLATSGYTTALSTSRAEYMISTITSNTEFNSTDRIRVKGYAYVSGLGSAPSVWAYIQGSSLTRLEIPVGGISIEKFVPYSGSVYDLDLGTHNITASWYKGRVLASNAPVECPSGTFMTYTNLTTSTCTAPSTISGAMTINGTTINSSGVYSGGSKINEKAYDVVVCKGTSLADDEIKKAQCDVVCLSTDNNCSNELNNAVDSENISILIKGTFRTYTSGNLPGNAANWIVNKDNVNIDAYGAVFISDVNSSVLLYINASNVHINGGTFLYDGIVNKSQAGVTNGIYITDSQDVHLNDITVKGFNHFQLIINSIAENTTNIVVESSKFEGNGNNDIIGGGTTSPALANNVQPSNIKIINNFISHVANYSGYNCGICLTKFKDSELIGNYLTNAYIALSDEKCPNNNIKVNENNINYNNQFKASNYGISSLCTENNSILEINHNVINNTDGGIKIYGTENFQIKANTVDLSGINNTCLYVHDSLVGNIENNIFKNCKSSSNINIDVTNYTNLKGNRIYIKNSSNYGDNAIVLKGKHNDLINNYVYTPGNKTRSLWLQSSNSKITDNTFISNWHTIKIESTAINSSIYDNSYTNITSLFDGVTNDNYYDFYQYTSTPSCQIDNVFNGKMIYNNTHSLICLSGTWQSIQLGTINKDISGNITLGQKITFSNNEVIDNINDGNIRVTGNLNVSNYNLTVNCVIWTGGGQMCSS